MKGQLQQMNGMNILKILTKKGNVALLSILLLTGCADIQLDNNNENEVTESNGSDSSKNISNDVSEESSIDEEDSTANDTNNQFGNYSRVLNNEETFYCFDWTDSDVTFEEYGESIMAEGMPEIDEYVFVDLDGQNGEELILHILDGGGNYLILTEEDNHFYGTNLGVRSFENLQEDGKFSASGGAGYNYYYTMKIGRDGVELDCFAEQHSSEDDDGNYSYELVVNGVEEDDYEEWINENFSNPINWLKY